VLQNFGSELVLLDSREGGGASRGSFNEGYDDFGASGGSTRTQSRPQPAAFDTDLDDDVPF
jgi:single-strand DNA-binding protein